MIAKNFFKINKYKTMKNDRIYKQLYLNHLLLQDFIKQLNKDLSVAKTRKDLRNLKHKYVDLKKPVFT